MSTEGTDRDTSWLGRPDDLIPWMVGRRRHLHAEPEVGINRPDTQVFLEAELTALAPEVHPAAGLTVRVAGYGGTGSTRASRCVRHARSRVRP